MFFSLQALKNDVPLDLPYSQNGIKVLTSGINLIFKIPHRDVIITFGITGFSVNLPYKYFGNNTQGHCGKNIFFSNFHFFSESFPSNVIFIISLCLYPQERATTTRRTTACYHQDSWFKAVQLWPTIGLQNTFTNLNARNPVFHLPVHLNLRQPMLLAIQTLCVICFIAGRLLFF